MEQASSDSLPQLTGSIRHIRSRDGLRSTWRKIASVVYSPRILSGLPSFTDRIARTFWETDPSAVITAVSGDPAFFVAFQLRLDQIDCAMVSAGRSLAERAPVIRSKWILDGFRQSAVDALLQQGGSWPPSVDVEPA
jgi:hypothetical protein